MSCNVTCEINGGKGAGKALTTGATAPVLMRVVWASVSAEALPARVARLTYLQQYLIVSRLHLVAARCG